MLVFICSGDDVHAVDGLRAVEAFAGEWDEPALEAALARRAATLGLPAPSAAERSEFAAVLERSHPPAPSLRHVLSGLVRPGRQR